MTLVIAEGSLQVLWLWLVFAVGAGALLGSVFVALVEWLGDLLATRVASRRRVREVANGDHADYPAGGNATRG